MSLTLHDLTTRELLNAVKGNYWPLWEYESGYREVGQPIFVGKRYVAGGNIEEVHARPHEILAVLNTREHVPGKREAKVIRRLRAETGMSTEELRAHSKYGQELVDAQFPNRRPVSAAWAKKMRPFYGSSFQQAFKIV
jgi:hypothetical protein